ncbi:MAG TPA: MFS transporter [Mycobacteriales bacterium]|nr:MFS transporter [Mycobacteriales bacterium]
MRGAWRPLAAGPFRWFWLGQSASMVGSAMLPLALTLYVLGAGGGAGQVGLVLAARSAGTIGTLLAGGVLADRRSKRAVMLAADGGRLLFVAGIAATLPTGSVLVAAAFALGVGEGLFYPAYNTVVVELLPERDLQAGNGLNSLSQRVAAVAGPLLAGVLVAGAGARWCFWVDAVTFAVSVLTLVRLPAGPRPVAEPGRPVAALVEGFGEVRRRPWVAALIAMDGVQGGLAMAPATVLLPVLLLARGGTATTYAVVVACSAVGSVLGSLVSSAVRPRLPGLAAIALLTPVAAYLVAIGAGAPVPVLAGLAVLAGAGQEVSLVLWYTSLQTDLPRAALGRVNSIDWLGSMALYPVGFALVGPVARALGGSRTVLAGAALYAGAAALPLLRRDVREFRTTPARGREPVTVEEA